MSSSSGEDEAFANKNSVLDSALDGIGMGLGFTLGLRRRGKHLRRTAFLRHLGRPTIRSADGSNRHLPVGRRPYPIGVFSSGTNNSFIGTSELQINFTYS